MNSCGRNVALTGRKKGTALSNDEETPVVYSLRFTIRAARDLDEICVRIADMEGESASFAWEDEFGRTFRSLSTNPRRYAVPTDAAGFAGEVRAVTFRRAEGTAPYRLIYRISESLDDGPLVELLHIRHGAAHSLTKRDAREIETQNRE